MACPVAPLADRDDARALCVVLLGVIALAFVGVHVAQLLFSGTRFGLYLDPSSSVYVGPNPRLNAIVTSGMTWAFALVASRFAGKPIGRIASALLACATLAFALNVSAAFLPFIIDRVARYFAPMLILLMPMALDWLPAGRLRRSCAVIVLVAWIAATYVQVIAGGQYGVVPYQSYLMSVRWRASSPSVALLPFRA